MTTADVTVYEHLLRMVGHSRVKGAHRIVGRLAPRHKETRRFCSRFFDLNYEGDLSDFIDWNIFYFGAYSRGELDFLALSANRLSRSYEGINFFDIGANTGQHSLFMSRRAKSVYAFEPSNPVVERFQLNVSKNKLTNVHVHRVALADKDVEAELGSGFPGNSGSRSLNWSLPGSAGERVFVRNGDAFFREHDLPRMHLVKLDVEGHEKKVLKGLEGRLRSDRPVIMMELIGQAEKGGYASVDELRSALYPQHELRSLRQRRSRHQLVEFDWECDCAVVLPSEVIGLFAKELRDNGGHT